MNGSAEGMLSMIIDTRPAIKSVSAWLLPWYGTCSRSMPAMLWNNSLDKWVELPAPDDAKLSLPGCARPSAISSCTLAAGNSIGTASTLVIDAT